MNQAQTSEKELQDQVLTWLSLKGFIAFHIPNHGFQGKNGHYNIVGKHHLPGIPDIAIILREGRVLWVELKKPSGGKVSDAQQAFMQSLHVRGHYVLIARSVIEIETYLMTRCLKP